MRRPYRAAPPWGGVFVAVAIAIALRVWLPAHGAGDAGPGHLPPPAVAFLGFLIFIGELIWKGLEVAGKISLTVLHWIVINLSLVVTKIGNGLKALGSSLLQALKRSWDFTRRLYDDVLKPAWEKFWRWFDKFRRWLDDTFQPVLDWLRELRDNVLLFYRNYIRPWLDLIDVTRKLVRVLAALHVPFARQLDARLGRLEELIDKPFRYVLAKLNEVINVVNRIMTLDGLLQRLVLIRSLERDYLYAWRAAMNPYRRDLTDDEHADVAKQQAGKPFAAIVADHQRYLRDRGGPYAPLLDEMTLIWRGYLVRR